MEINANDLPRHLLTCMGLSLAIMSSGLAQRRKHTQPPVLPNSSLTPGAVLMVNAEDVCLPGYSKSVPDLPQAVKELVYRNYDITHYEPGEYQIDRLISVGLGGSNSFKNLWPQSYRTQPWNARVKDELEKELQRQVCEHKLELKVAQQDIAKDWIAAYKKYFHTELPKSSHKSSQKRLY